MNIQESLFSMQDEKIRLFNAKLIPNLPLEKFIGIRTPVLRKFAKELYKNEPEKAKEFMKNLPHKYFEENQLHTFLIEQIKDYDECIAEIEKFLPYIDNWATCDSFTPKLLKKYPKELHKKIKLWIKSEHCYTVRYAIGCLLSYYLDEEFSPKDLELIAKIKSEEYYINMMIAWYFSFALIKQYDATIGYIEEKRLGDFVHRKTIQKAVESLRISDERKEYLKSFRK